MIPYAGLPVGFGVISLILFFTCYREDSLEFLVKKGPEGEDQAFKLIYKVYNVPKGEAGLSEYEKLKPKDDSNKY